MRRSNPQLEEEIAHLHCNKRSAAQVSQRALAMTFKQRGVQSERKPPA